MMIGYFDNAATTYKKPDGMYEYMADFMVSNGANVGRGIYNSAITSSKIVADARANLLSLVNAPENKTVVFYAIGYNCSKYYYFWHWVD